MGDIFDQVAGGQTPQNPPPLQQSASSAPQGGDIFDQVAAGQQSATQAGQVDQSAPGTMTGQVATLSAPAQPKSTMGKLAQWIDNVSLDMQDGGDRTGVGTVMQKLGAHGLHNGNSAAVGDFMASLPLGLLKAGKGGAELVPSAIGGEKGNTWRGVKDLVGGGLQAVQEPAAFVAPEGSALSEEGLLSDAASAASNAASKVGGKAVAAAKGVETWVKANPVKALVVEGMARELGVDPMQLASKMVKYGKGLFGTQ